MYLILFGSNTALLSGALLHRFMCSLVTRYCYQKESDTFEEVPQIDLKSLYRQVEIGSRDLTPSIYLKLGHFRIRDPREILSPMESKLQRSDSFTLEVL